MRKYLVVVEEGASARSLRFGLLNLVSEQKGIELILLQTQDHYGGESEAEARRDAVQSVAAIWAELVAMGLPVIDAIAGDPLPRKAIAAEMTAGRHRYDGIVLTSKAPGLLRMLHFDPAHQLERRYQVPVVSIDPEAAPAISRLAGAEGGRR